MSIASGLGATFGVAAETTVGTFTSTSMRWPPFLKESLKKKPHIIQSAALHGSGLYELGARRAYTTRTVDGTVDLEITDRQLGIFFQQMLGSSATATQIGATTAYQQVHTPGDTVGKSMSMQVGRPQTNGTVQPFSYNGVKVTDWEISVKTNQIATFNLTLDAWDEATGTAYVAPSYLTPPANVLKFSDASLILGGTVTTTSGVASLSGGSTAAAAEDVTIKGTNALKVDRFFLGSAGIKAEQLANQFRKITGSATFEFQNLTDVYNAFAAQTPTALQLTFTGSQIGTSGHNASLQILIPTVFFDEGPPVVEGPDVLKQAVTFTGLDDGTDPVIQFTYVSADTTV